MKKYFYLVILFSVMVNYSNAISLNKDFKTNLNLNSITSITPTFTMIASLCEGLSTNVTANTGTSIATGYTWTANPGGPSIASPNSSVTGITFASAGVYTITLSATDGTNTASTFNTITIYSNPTVSISMSPISGNICPPPAFGSAWLMAGGASSYTWMPGNVVNATDVVQPPVSTTYMVTGTDVNGCIGSASQYVNVYRLPSLFASGPASACNGSTACLSASGSLVIYSWSGPCGFSSNQQNPCLIIATGCGCTYTVGGTDMNQCVNTKTVCVTVNQNPVLNVSSTNSIICAGQTSTVTANGANTYSWSTGALSSSVAVSPGTTTTYSVIGTTAGCINQKTISIAVNPSPTLNVNSTDSVLCAGLTATLMVNGSANSYSWSNGATGVSDTISPGVTTTYTVVGTNSLGCQSFATITQSVDLCTGVAKTNSKKIDEIKLYPNPSTGILNIETEVLVSTTASIEITNSLGQIVLKEKINNKKSSYNISHLPNGIYFIEINVDGNMKTSKFLRQ